MQAFTRVSGSCKPRRTPRPTTPCSREINSSNRPNVCRRTATRKSSLSREDDTSSAFRIRGTITRESRSRSSRGSLMNKSVEMLPISTSPWLNQFSAQTKIGTLKQKRNFKPMNVTVWCHRRRLMRNWTTAKGRHQIASKMNLRLSKTHSLQTKARIQNPLPRPATMV